MYSVRACKGGSDWACTHLMQLALGGEHGGGMELHAGGEAALHALQPPGALVLQIDPPHYHIVYRCRGLPCTQTNPDQCCELLLDPMRLRFCIGDTAGAASRKVHTEHTQLAKMEQMHKSITLQSAALPFAGICS